jgi:hypothetical protein
MIASLLQRRVRAGQGTGSDGHMSRDDGSDSGGRRRAAPWSS